MHDRRGGLVLVAFALLVAQVVVFGTLPSLATAAASGTATSTISSNKRSSSSSFPFVGINRDPFVDGSPLVVGVVCSDGVLLLAFHSIFSETNDESPLLLSTSSQLSSENSKRISDSENERAGANGEAESVKSSSEMNQSKLDTEEEPSSDTAIPLDLPESYRGPFRIHSLDAFGSAAMVGAGWRTDCQVLADHLRAFEKSETYVFGATTSPGSTTQQQQQQSTTGGAVLADRASIFLARCAVSERRRSLSCVGLLASSFSSSSSSANGGKQLSLWLVDATGAYAVRAHALGRSSEGVNDILRTKDWTKLESSVVREELLSKLLRKPNPSNSNNDDSDQPKLELSKGSRVEMAIVEAPSLTNRNTKQRQTIKRLFASST